MPRIRISGPALAYANSPKAKKPDSLTLARFHGWHRRRNVPMHSMSHP